MFGLVLSIQHNTFVIESPGQSMLVNMVMHTCDSRNACSLTIFYQAPAKTGKGLDELREQIREHLGRAELSVSGAQVVLTGRSEEGLKQAGDALARAKELLAGNRTIEEPELVVMELYEANAALGAITGQISSKEVLEDIFSRFCVGK